MQPQAMTSGLTWPPGPDGHSAAGSVAALEHRRADQLFSKDAIAIAARAAGHADLPYGPSS